LLAKDNCDAAPKLYIKDPVTGFVAGPFAVGDKVKVTQSPDQPPEQKPGAGVLVAHVITQGEPTLYAVDAAGNVSGDYSSSFRHHPSNPRLGQLTFVQGAAASLHRHRNNRAGAIA